MSKRPAPWNDQENAAVIRLYFDMLGFALAGNKYNKAGMIRSYQFSDEGKHPEALAARSRGSIEAKLMNCSAAHRDVMAADALTLTPESFLYLTMDGYGYRALSNYQSSLKSAMATQTETRRRCYISSTGKSFA